MNESQLQAEAAAWVSDFEAAITAQDRSRLTDLLCDPSYYRDNGALTWDYRQFHGREVVVSTLLSLAREAGPSRFRLSESWPSPQLLGAGDSAIIEAFFDFDTKDGAAVLLLNAIAEGGRLKARAIFTRLEDLKIIEKAPPHPRGRGFTPSFPGETWKEHRDAARRYDNAEPEVMVIGAGQAGLTTSAYLRKFGVDVLNVDRHERVGDSWNKRYDSLFLHNPIEMNDFPFLSFPPHYPEYLPKDLIGEWLDLYARYMDLNVWTSTTFKSARYDGALQQWDAVLGLPDGSERVLHPRHIVLATGGIGGKPSMPSFPGLDSFVGKVIHSSQYTRSADYGIKKAVIIGVATSAHDIARDLVEHEIAVTMFQRDPVVVNNVATANLAYAAYMDPQIPTPLVDIRYGIGLINPLREKASQAYHKMAKDLDRPLLSRLEAAGLQLGDGVNGQGWLDLFLRSGGGYYLNTGTSELIADGAVKIEPFQRLVEFVPTGAKLDDSSIVEADIVILATGYQSRRTEVVDFFGEVVADTVGEIARLDPEGEWANIWGQTAQRGLWFNGGGINQMRPGSARLALLITADLNGLIPETLRRGFSSEAPEMAREAVG